MHDDFVRAIRRNIAFRSRAPHKSPDPPPVRDNCFLSAGGFMCMYIYIYYIYTYILFLSIHTNSNDAIRSDR